MARREWGIRDRRTGQVWRSIDFAVAQDCANQESARVELVVRWRGGPWVAVEWYVQDASFSTPAPPAAARRRSFVDWQGIRSTKGVVRALYGHLSRLAGAEQGLFRRHNG